MALSEDIDKVLEEFGTKVKDDLQQSLRDKGVQFGGNDSKLSAAIDFTVTNTGGVTTFKLFMPRYGEAVDGGRGKGLTPPPIAPIENWIKRKGLKPKPNENRDKQVKTLKNKTVRKAIKSINRGKLIKSMAIAIAKNIGKNGTTGNNFYSEVMEDGRLDKLKADLTEVMKTDIGIEIIDLAKT